MNVVRSEKLVLPTAFTHVAGRPPTSLPAGTSVNDARLMWGGREAAQLNLAAPRGQVNEVAADTYEPTTWQQRVSLLRNFREFCLYAGVPLNLDAVPIFLELKKLKYPTKVKYGTTLRSILTREVAVVDACLVGCRKREAREEVRQAEPITPEEMQVLVEEAPSAGDATMMQSAWITASRFGGKRCKTSGGRTFSHRRTGR
ncbi:hypothetical protein NESM_000726200 [Novymonas esmeraldas]|uniref:Uncharacterized protein n=1 Tax=Novymonas esmeraldas TaxID=1808958 RepID=A0AAW0EU10_9TRYP